MLESIKHIASHQVNSGKCSFFSAGPYRIAFSEAASLYLQSMSEERQYENTAPQNDAFVERPVGEVQVSGLRKITLQLDDNGQIDWERTSDKAKEAFGAVVANDATALEMIGLAASAGSSENVTPQEAHLIWDAEGAVKSAILQKVLKLHPQIAAQAFHYTEEQHKLLDEPLANVLNKYSSQWMKEHKEIAALVFGYVIVTKQQMTLAINSQKAYLIQVRDQQQGAQPINGGEVQPQ